MPTRKPALAHIARIAPAGTSIGRGLLSTALCLPTRQRPAAHHACSAPVVSVVPSQALVGLGRRPEAQSFSCPSSEKSASTCCRDDPGPAVDWESVPFA